MSADQTSQGTMPFIDFESSKSFCTPVPLSPLRLASSRGNDRHLTFEIFCSSFQASSLANIVIELDSAVPVPASQRVVALSRWENEGGALAQTDTEGLASLGVPPLTNTELVQLRIRIVAVENLLLALLAEGTEAQRTLAKEMAGCILPRDGYTSHPLTIHAAEQMLKLVERASRFTRLGK